LQPSPSESARTRHCHHGRPSSIVGFLNPLESDRLIAVPLIKRSLSLAGHRTSISLEPDYWAEIDRIAAAQGRSLASLVAEIDANRKDEPLASSVRVWVLKQTLERVPSMPD